MRIGPHNNFFRPWPRRKLLNVSSLLNSIEFSCLDGKTLSAFINHYKMVFQPSDMTEERRVAKNPYEDVVPHTLSSKSQVVGLD